MIRKKIRGLHALLMIPLLLSISAADSLLKTEFDLPLPGKSRRFDYQSLDPKRELLFIAQMGEGRLLAIDLKKNQVVASIPGVPGATGVLAVPELNRVYVSISGTGEVGVIDEDRFRLITKMPGGKFPDGLAYDPNTQKLFVSDETGEAVIVIDTKTDRRIDRIAAGGEVGNSQYDPASRRIYANIQSRNELIAIDPSDHRIVRRIQLKEGAHPHGLLIDPAHRLAFVACDGDAALLVVDLESGETRQRFPVGKEPDVLAFDPGLNLLYVASESGTLSIFKQEGTLLKKEGDFFVAPKAHSISVDPESHRLYLPLQNVNGRPALRVMVPAAVLLKEIPP